jgi:lipopolysaccharide transport system ATP-binding protein
MNDTAIKVDHLSKHYRLGRGPMGRGDFRDAVTAAAGRIGRWIFRAPRPEDGHGERDLWALDDVSFEINKGEVVGIIGHNGAGKSTLLKILSRITDPTSGEAWYEGRVGSLLEVGTGFHPELTGRENVFLSGAILGMSRREIAGRFDEIVEFSEMARFIDTPVKRYSSGMYVRLGFAVAAHLEPEILIVDEVLAVGDAAFQRKCLARMREFAGGGRTILFVSHNVGSIQSLCDRALVLSSGRLIVDAPPDEAVRRYLQTTVDQRDVEVAQRTHRRGQGGTRIVKAFIMAVEFDTTSDAPSMAGSPPGLLLYGQGARVDIELSERLSDLACTFAIYDSLNRPLCRFTSRAIGPDDRVGESRAFRCDIPELALVPGDYYINVAIASSRGLEDHLDAAITFRVMDGALACRPLAPEQKSAVFAPRHRWIVPGREGD